MTPEERAEDCIQKWQDGDYQPTVLEDVLRDAITAAIAEEREACATVAETMRDQVTNPYFFEKNGYKNACEGIAAAIRARA